MDPGRGWMTGAGATRSTSGPLPAHVLAEKQVPLQLVIRREAAIRVGRVLYPGRSSLVTGRPHRDC